MVAKGTHTATVELERDAALGRLAVELRRMTRLHELSARLGGPGDTRALLEEIVRAAIEITGASKAKIQITDGPDELKIVAQVGFEPPFLEHFARVSTHSDCACGAALASRERLIAEDVDASPVFAGSTALPVLRAAGVRAMQSTPLFARSGTFVGMFSTHFAEPHRFEPDELRWLDLLARHAGDVLERHGANEILRQSHAELERRVADRTRWLGLMHDISRTINEVAAWDEALRRILSRICELENWQIGHLYLSDPTTPAVIAPLIGHCADRRFQPFVAQTQQLRFTRGDRLPGRVHAIGVPVWIDAADELYRNLPTREAEARGAGLRSAAILPIILNREVIGVLELFSDRPHPPSEPCTALMRDIADQVARVIERERITARMAALLWGEQQDLLHTLHDAVGQTLTGLGLLSNGLRERLMTSAPAEAATAAEIGRYAKEALVQVRQLTKSLFPVDVDSESLTAALRDLATATESLHKIHVRVEGTAPKLVRDGSVATQLYRIAQEAVTNAVRHANAHSITIQLRGDGGVVVMRVIDDGVGIRDNGPSNGMGLKIMRYRAQSAGGNLTVEALPSGGTAVTCTVRPPPAGRNAE